MSIAPKKPATLDPRAERLLEWMGAQPWAHLIVLGGGVALKHYLDYRGTKDCDAWWHADATATKRSEIVAVIGVQMDEQNPGHSIKHDKWGDVDSLKLMRGARAVFSFQIADRSVQLEPYLPSCWGGVQLESLRENVAAKINALVARGAGRDFRDIYEVHHQLGFGIKELWQLWKVKNPVGDIATAKKLARVHLEGICMQRPLEEISGGAERAKAAAVREWYLTTFLSDAAGN
jgi:hypothetical protein